MCCAECGRDVPRRMNINGVLCCDECIPQELLQPPWHRCGLCGCRELCAYPCSRLIANLVESGLCVDCFYRIRQKNERFLYYESMRAKYAHIAMDQVRDGA